MQGREVSPERALHRWARAGGGQQSGLQELEVPWQVPVTG